MLTSPVQRRLPFSKTGAELLFEVISRACPRRVERPDGMIVPIYYFWDRKTGPERYIAATIWDPDTGRDS